MLKKIYKIFYLDELILEATVPQEVSDDEIMRISWDWLTENIAKDKRELCRLEIGEEIEV